MCMAIGRQSLLLWAPAYFIANSVPCCIERAAGLVLVPKLCLGTGFAKFCFAGTVICASAKQSFADGVPKQSLGTRKTRKLLAPTEDLFHERFPTTDSRSSRRHRTERHTHRIRLDGRGPRSSGALLGSADAA